MLTQPETRPDDEVVTTPVSSDCYRAKLALSQIPGVGEDQEEKEETKHSGNVRYVSSFHALEFIGKERLGGLQKVFGELNCPACGTRELSGAIGACNF